MALTGAAIEAIDGSVGAARIDDVRISRVDGHPPALTLAKTETIARIELSVIGADGRSCRAAVLLRAVDVIRKLIVDDYVIELRGGLVVPGAPGDTTVQRNSCALIRGETHTK